ATGFESAQALTQRRVAGTVSSGSFGAASAAPTTTAPKQPVKTVGFADDRTTPAMAAAEKPRVVTSVEVLFKPIPTYSDEARAKKIQGEVTLEVNFTATGQVKVQRVVRGLGYGLDELAIRAAEQIRFKPAQTADGRPMDFTANVQIVFRLT